MITGLINFMAEDAAPTEFGRQQEQESPTPSQERKHLSKEERQQALAAPTIKSYCQVASVKCEVSCK